MPLYDFICPECTEYITNILVTKYNTSMECPKCGEDMIVSLHPPSLHFKGTGFYSTDYKRNSDISSDTGQVDE